MNSWKAFWKQALRIVRKKTSQSVLVHLTNYDNYLLKWGFWTTAAAAHPPTHPFTISDLQNSFRN